MSLTYRPTTNATVPALQAPDRAYLVMDGDRLRGVVAGSGRAWVAGPIAPSRTRIPPWWVWGETRSAAAETMTRGRP